MEFHDFLSPSVYCPSLLAGPLGCIQCPHRADICKFFAGWPMLVSPSENIAYEIIFNSPAEPCVSCSSWMVFEMAGKWSYSYCFCGLLLPGLVQNHIIFLCSFFSFFLRFDCIHIAAWKKFSFPHIHSLINNWFIYFYTCCILTLDRAVNQRCVNKRKKWKQESVMKDYRQVLETGRPEWGPACRLKAVALSDSWLSNSSQDAKEVLLWSRKEVGSI